MVVARNGHGALPGRVGSSEKLGVTVGVAMNELEMRST